MFKSQGRCPSQMARGVRCNQSAEHSGFHTAIDSEGQSWSWLDDSCYKPEQTVIKERERITLDKPIPSWRWWKVGRRGILTSITSKHKWHSPVMTTQKNSEGEPCKVNPDNPIRGGSTLLPEHDWGVYSYKTPRLLLDYNERIVNKFNQGTGFLVLGRVDNFGHVIEHELGFRAQKTIVRKLFVFHPMLTAETAINPSWIKQLENKYECPVRLLAADRLQTFADYYSDPAENPDAQFILNEEGDSNVDF